MTSGNRPPAAFVGKDGCEYRVDNKRGVAIYLRPRTRGELVRELRSGTPCEVVADNESWTRMLIDGWLAPQPYITRPSENTGWVVFEIDNKSGEMAAKQKGE